MKSNYYLATELFLLFVLLPISLVITYPIALKASFILIGFIYISIILLRVEKISFKVKSSIDWKAFWKRILLLFLGVILTTTLYVFIIDSNKLFCVVLNKPLLWIAILGVYTLLSVWPQEIIYRTFFFARYESLFQNKKLFIFINAILFSLAHLFFKNTLVIVLTFIGGLLFAYTYHKTKSTFLASMEHALYGNWLFTVGMGEMLAFPGAESC
ncbi:MAG: membrane protease YdiL (CAAX protease family) [Flavobacteriaceae bacterium]|jgi:membrane protease YdiL (CAAX protease family)|uniref:CPBP family intramembrane glutamic endopeptidase n=1 Tax=Candidatus Marifrigoribacter sp. Uisw_064 TaxID=3230970 RepID=UPI003AE2E2EE